MALIQISEIVQFNQNDVQYYPPEKRLHNYGKSAFQCIYIYICIDIDIDIYKSNGGFQYLCSITRGYTDFFFTVFHEKITASYVVMFP